MKNNKEQNKGRKIVPLPITFKRPREGSNKKLEFIKVELKINPMEDGSQTYRISFPIFKQGSPDKFLAWRTNWDKTVAGQGITTRKAKFNLAKTLLQGEALQTFSNAATGETSKTNKMFKIVIATLMEHVFPKSAILHQKWYLCHFLCKGKKTSEIMLQEFES